MQLPGYTKEELGPAAPIKRTQKEVFLPEKYVKMLEKTCCAPRSKAVEKFLSDLKNAAFILRKNYFEDALEAKVLFFLIGCFFFFF